MKLNKIIMTTIAMFSASAFATDVVTHKSPYCGCCSEWVKHMEDEGFNVKVIDHENMNPIKQKLGIAPQLASCHTAVIDGYVFEGHVPAQDIKTFLAEKPKLAGLAVPGMPMGSPGMEYGNKKDAFDVVGFTKTGMTVTYSSYNK